MTSIHTYDPASGAVPPELPPMSIAILAVGVLDVLCEAEDLPQPRYITIHARSQSFSLQFAPARASLKTLTRWALRFGAVLTSQPRQGEDGPETWCSLAFDYYGIAVDAYARIPAETAST